MFLLVPQFSSLVSLIGLGGFSPGFHFSLQQFLCLAELASKEKDNCNNVTLGAESFQSGSQVTAIIQNFTLVSLTSTAIPHPIGLLCGAMVLSRLMHLTSYALNSSPSISGKVIPALISIYVLSTCQSMRFIIFECHLVTKSKLLIRCNETSSLMKLTTSSLVLVKVY